MFFFFCYLVETTIFRDISSGAGVYVDINGNRPFKLVNVIFVRLSTERGALQIGSSTTFLTLSNVVFSNNDGDIANDIYCENSEAFSKTEERSEITNTVTDSESNSVVIGSSEDKSLLVRNESPNTEWVCKKIKKK
jgi:hypothetical protein